MPNKCHDCQKNIPKRTFTTHVEALFCDECNKRQHEESILYWKNYDRAIAAYPELEYADQPTNTHLIGFRPDIQMMEERTTFVVFSDYDEDGNPRVVVFDTESEKLAKEKVKSDPTVEMYFDREIIAMNSCIQKLTSNITKSGPNPKGRNDATKFCPQ